MPYTRGDDKLHITFCDMGHGDFIPIALPNGKLLVIDCGSKGFDGNYWNPKQDSDVLRARAFRSAFEDQRLLGNNQSIDLLILTHPDKDHCFYCSNLFIETYTGQKPAPKAVQAFYSSTLNNYDKHGVPNIIFQYVDTIYSITINQNKTQYGEVERKKYRTGAYLTEKDIETSAKGTAELLKKSDVEATRGFVKVLDGTGKDGIACGVYILASNVESYANLDDGSSPGNRGSIVTMIIYGDKKLLFMGDGTFNTEHFLKQTYSDRIKEVELLHVPHHASLATSSSAAGHPPAPPSPNINFVGLVNPCYVVITAAWDVGQKLALPRYEVIDRYHSGSRLKTKPADIEDQYKQISCYRLVTTDVPVKTDADGRVIKFRKESGNAQAIYPATKHIWCTGSHGKIDFDYGPDEKGSINLLPADAEPESDTDDE
ncbi:MAG TPA: hypothetical protein VGD58_09020 [Herpetosiphonaceae bacterium]